MVTNYEKANKVVYSDGAKLVLLRCNFKFGNVRFKSKVLKHLCCLLSKKASLLS